MPIQDSAYSGWRQAAYGPARTSVASLNPAMKAEVQTRPSAAQATSASPPSRASAPQVPASRSLSETATSTTTVPSSAAVSLRRGVLREVAMRGL